MWFAAAGLTRLCHRCWRRSLTPEGWIRGLWRARHNWKPQTCFHESLHHDYLSVARFVFCWCCTEAPTRSVRWGRQENRDMATADLVRQCGPRRSNCNCTSSSSFINLLLGKNKINKYILYKYNNTSTKWFWSQKVEIKIFYSFDVSLKNEWFSLLKSSTMI